jgi:hypothetical protein
MSNMFFPQAKPLGRDPTLPLAASGQDSQYTAAEAQLRADINRRYADILQNLGYSNAEGQFMPGEVEAQANRQRSELGRNKGIAMEDVTKQSQQEGTLFSGRRAEQTARAQHPFVQALSDLDVDVPKQLNRLYEDAGRTLQDYTIQNNLLLADSAARASARAAAAGGGGYGSTWERDAGGGDPGLGGGVPTVGWTPEQAAAAQPQQGSAPSRPPQYKPGDPRWSQAAEYGWLG